MIESSQGPGTFLIADYGTGRVYTIAPGNGGDEAVPAEAPQVGEGGASGASGKKIVEDTCSACHTLAKAGATGTVGPNLDELKPSKALVEKQVADGGAGMLAWSGAAGTQAG